MRRSARIANRINHVEVLRNPPIENRINPAENPPIENRINPAENPPIENRINPAENPPVANRINPVEVRRNPRLQNRINPVEVMRGVALTERQKNAVNRHVNKIFVRLFSRSGSATPRECLQIALDGFKNPDKAVDFLKEIAADDETCQVGKWANLNSYVQRMEATEDGILIHPRVEGGTTKALIADHSQRCRTRVTSRDPEALTPQNANLASISLMPFSKRSLRSSYTYEQVVPRNSFLMTGFQKADSKLFFLAVLPLVIATFFHVIKDRLQKK